jgi:hypothetical protein
MSFASVSTTNNFVSSGALVTRSMAVGDNNDNVKSKLLGNAFFGVGSAYTQGNTVRSFYDMNSGPPLIYTPTSDDITLVTTKFKTLIKSRPIVGLYPWLSPYVESYPEVVNLSRTRPIYNILGKGLGKIEIYKCGNSLDGDYLSSKPLWMEHYYNFNITGDIPLQPKIKNADTTIYPFSGMMYSGMLTQYSFQEGDVKIIPYQAGRGIPQCDPTKDYYSGDPFGRPTFPNGVAIHPFLSPGVAAGNCDFCLGVSLDTQGRNKLFNYPKPNDFVGARTKNLPYNDHPAPHTVPPTNVSYTNVEKIQSPGPGLSGTTWSPWPWYYAYNSDDHVPILTEGKTSLKIGSAFNIGMQCYYEPDVEDGDDPVGNPKYLCVQTVPLFQGEKVKVGSEVAATSMGHVITWDRKGVSPYPSSSAISVAGNQVIVNTDSFPLFTNPRQTNGNAREARDENPWWDWCDPTFGAVGWTSTPGFSLNFIPDKGVAVCQSLITPLPYLAQSLQGSCVVRASTVVDPLDPLGSGRMELIGASAYNDTENKFQRMLKVPGDGERSQVVGNAMGEIEGTGRWRWDGSFEANTSVFINGLGYTPGLYSLVGGGGNSGIVEVLSVDAYGSITGISMVNYGSGYPDGGLVSIQSPTAVPGGTGSPFWFSNTATMVYTSTVPILACRGTGYTSGYGCVGFNVTKNLGVVEIDVRYTTTNTDAIPGQDKIQGFYGLPYSYFMKNVLDTSLFTPGRVLYGVNFKTSAKLEKTTALVIFYVKSNNGTDVELGIFYNNCGDSYAYPEGVHKFAIQFADYYTPMEVTIVADTEGQIENLKITDYGRGSENGDFILVYQPLSGNNYIFVLDMAASGDYGTQFVEGGGGYKFFQITPMKWPDPRNYCRLIQGGVDTGSQMRMTTATNCGNISGMSWVDTKVLTIDQAFVNYNVFSGSPDIGSKCIVQQIVQMNYESQPVTRPVDGWDNYAVIQNATIIMDGYCRVINGGTNNVVGPITFTGGSGIGMTLTVTQISDTGELLGVEITDYGTGMRANDVLTLGGGKVVLQLNPTDDVFYFMAEDTGLKTPASVMIFDYHIINSGTGYTAGSTVTTTCPNRSGVGMVAVVVSVGPEGQLEALTLLSTGNGLYNIGDVVTVDGGGGYFKLVRPVQPKKTNWHKRGTGYTTAVGVPTVNMQANNLIILADTGAGTLVPIGYNAPSHYRPPIWDLSRYNQGDELVFVQGGNQTARYTISFDGATGDTTYTPVSAGSGYTFGSSNYGWFGTINATEIPTTVDIVADADGALVSVVVNTIGDRFKFGDDLVVSQGDNNAVVRIQPLKNVTPWWENTINGRLPTASQWNDYKECLTGAVNLFDNQVVVDMKMNYPNYYNNSYYNNGDGGRDYVNNVGGYPTCCIS